MKCFLLSLCMIVLINSCASSVMKTTDTKVDEAIVFGKITIKNGDESIKNQKVLLHFNERRWGKHAVFLDENGYFYIKLPLKNNFLALIEYRNGSGFYKNIPDNYISINLSSSDKVYYVGDVELDWNMTNKDKRSNAGLVGALKESNKKGDFIPLKVNVVQETINHFKQLFPDNNKDIITTPFTVTNLGSE